MYARIYKGVTCTIVDRYLYKQKYIIYPQIGWINPF